MISCAGACLKHLSLEDHSSIVPIDCSVNTSIQTARFFTLTLTNAISILSTLASQDISTLDLDGVTVESITQLNALVDCLTSPYMLSLPKLQHINLIVKTTGTATWTVPQGIGSHNKKMIVLAKAKGCLQRLQDIFGERVHTDVFGSSLSWPPSPIYPEKVRELGFDPYAGAGDMFYG